MSPVIVSILPVLTAVFILLVGNGIVGTLVPLRAALEHFSQPQIGAIGSAYFIGMLAGTWLTPGIVRRAGHIRAFASYAAIAAVATLSFAIIVSHGPWMVLRATLGFCFAGLYAIVESWVNVKASNQNRGAMLALYNVVHFSGSACGQQVLRADDPRSFTMFSAAAMSLILSLVPMAMTKAEPPPLPPKGRLVILELYRASPIAAIGILIVGWVNGSFWSLAPAYAERIGLDAGGVATFMTAVIVGSAAGPYPLGRLSDLMDRRIVIGCTALLATVVEFGMAMLGGPNLWLISGLGFLIGVSLPVIYPLITAHAVDRMGSEKAVAISATLLFVYCIGAMAGPMVASLLISVHGQWMLFAHNAAVHAALAAYVAWRIIRRAPAQRRPVPDEVQSRPLR